MVIQLFRVWQKFCSLSSLYSLKHREGNATVSWVNYIMPLDWNSVCFADESIFILSSSFLIKHNEKAKKMNSRGKERNQPWIFVVSCKDPESFWFQWHWFQQLSCNRFGFLKEESRRRVIGIKKKRCESVMKENGTSKRNRKDKEETRLEGRLILPSWWGRVREIERQVCIFSILEWGFMVSVKWFGSSFSKKSISRSGGKRKTKEMRK